VTVSRQNRPVARQSARCLDPRDGYEVPFAGTSQQRLGEILCDVTGAPVFGTPVKFFAIDVAAENITKLCGSDFNKHR
jgi:hypothetical protein